MKYLDREPRPGDLVEVPAFRAIYRKANAGQMSATHPHLVSLAEVPHVEALAGKVRVIAPEPKVGDVVTADVSLPVGSLLEVTGERQRVEGVLARWGGAGWDCGFGRVFSTEWLLRMGDWRIVRIGGAQ